MSDAVKTGGPAFPLNMETALRPVTDMGGRDISSGMTLRDWFAGQAIAGLYACREMQLDVMHVELRNVDISGVTGFEKALARQAYAQADAMLAARKTGE